MVFTSLVYVIFLLLIVALYFWVPSKRQRGLLLLASYFFYAYWKPQYLFLLFGITTIDYFAAIGTEKATRPLAKRCWLSVSIVANLGILFFYKYYDFIATSVNAASGMSNIGFNLPVLDLLIPLGISFHTFQSISYAVDVYRGAYKAERDYLNLALFISFFPQLVAGPIERAGHLLPQLVRINRFDLSQCMGGALLVAYGFFKKLVLADNLAILVDQYFLAQGPGSGGLCLVAVYAFAFQIYFDFSGYTDIARGSGRMLGIEMIENFRAPYLSTSVREFWRRWHISLTNWFRDFVYRPLLDRGVSRNVCVFVVFALSGLWHGANWTFLIWGLLNAFFYFVMSDDRKVSSLTDMVCCWANAVSSAKAVVRCLITFNLVCLTWVFFRAASVAEALGVLKNIATGASTFEAAIGHVAAEHPTRLAIVMCGIAADCLIEVKMPGYAWIDKLVARKSWPFWTTFILLVYLSLCLGQLGVEQFIYFQF